MTTASQILNLLNRQSLTVLDLAKVLGISRNSVHLQVTRLEAAGLIARGRQRRSVGAGKPAYEYSAKPGGEDSYSSASKPVLETLIETLSSHLHDAEIDEALEQTGRVMAQRAGLKSQGNLRADLRRAVDDVNQLGAMAEISTEEDGMVVTSYSCMLASVVRVQPLGCGVLAGFFSEAVGSPVRVQCRRNAKLVCRFVVE